MLPLAETDGSGTSSLSMKPSWFFRITAQQRLASRFGCVSCTHPEKHTDSPSDCSLQMRLSTVLAILSLPALSIDCSDETLPLRLLTVFNDGAVLYDPTLSVRSERRSGATVAYSLSAIGEITKQSF